MTEDGEKASDKPRPRYVWDAEKSAWVDVGETPPEEAKARIVEPEEPEETVIGEPLDEGVPLDVTTAMWRLQYKSILMRFAGGLVDLIVLSIIGMLVTYIIGRFIEGIPNYILPILGLFYYVGFWWWRGQTPGKMLIRAKVVKKDGGDVDVGRALVRFIFYAMPSNAPIMFVAGNYLGGWVIILLPLIVIVAAALNRQRQGVHDLIAGTVVIDTRVPVSESREVFSAEAEQSDASDSDTADEV